MLSDTIVSGHILATAVPANVTVDAVHKLSGMDLAMKLHYLRSVYYFKPSVTIEGLGDLVLNDPMFLMLDTYYPVAGRIRHNESGRPYIKCNDSGVRIVEARCGRTIDEWLEMKEYDRYKHLVSDKVLGPDLYYSPLVLIQFTRFKCGGLAVGISWAHVLGDAISASNCINLWRHFLTGNQVPKAQHHLHPKNEMTLPATTNPLSVKQVKSVGDFWLTPTKHRMVTSSFLITETKLKHLQSKISSHIPPFEAISALIWQSLAKIRVGKEPNLVTILKNDSSKKRCQILSNEPIISTVQSDSSPAKLELSELGMLISNRVKDEKKEIEEMVERLNGKMDFVVYGANLTFVDMEGIELYGLELKGQKPIHIDYSIDGMGDEGAVLVLREPNGARSGDGGDGGNGGRVVTVILPEDEIAKLGEVLESEWGIA